MDRAGASAWPRHVARGGLCGAVAFSAPVVVLGTLTVGREAFIGWVLALLVVCVYFLGSVLGDALATRRMDRGGLVVLLNGFLVRAGLVAFVLWQLVTHQVLADDVRNRWFGWATLGLVIGWTAGVVFIARSVRTLIHDEPTNTREGTR